MDNVADLVRRRDIERIRKMSTLVNTRKFQLALVNARAARNAVPATSTTDARAKANGEIVRLLDKALCARRLDRLSADHVPVPQKLDAARNLEDGAKVWTIKYVGYRMNSRCPKAPNWGSYYGCACGRCHGVPVLVSGVWTGVTFWMDNSIEGSFVDAAGKTHRQMYVAPHGDLCF
jgi:hypothetical protein